MGAIQSALFGMQSATDLLNKTANNVARLPAATDTVDLSAEMVNLLQARNDFAANTKVVHVADELQQSTLSILA